MRSDGRPTAQEKREAEASAQRAANGGHTNVEALNQKQVEQGGIAVADAHGEVARPASAGAKVTVACKIGVAWLDIQLCRIEDKFEQNMQGGRTVKEAVRVGQVVRLRGTSYPRGTPPDGFPERPEMVGGAALTRGVDREFWDEWVKQNRLNPIVTNGMVFAHESEQHVRGMALETAAVLSGLEPVNPKGDARAPKSSRSEVTNVETSARSGAI